MARKFSSGISRLLRGLLQTRWLSALVPGAIAGTAIGLAGCGPSGEAALYRPRTYAFPVPPGVTFDLQAGQEIPDDDLAARLAHIRVIFVGENHNEPRSHAFQVHIIRQLIAAGRKVTVALEMLTPDADKALEGWRTGKLSEEEFLSQSQWYTRWGFPWKFYQPVFELVREHKLPIHGINAEEAERAAARKGDLAELSPSLQEEIGDLSQHLRPHTFQFEDLITSAGHGSSLQPGSERFESMRRVQWLWERLMGVRAVRLAEAAGGRSHAERVSSIVVVLIGSGHLRYGLGAQLQAARVTTLPTLSVVDQIVAEEDGPLYPVAVGTGNWVRLYPRPPEPPSYPALVGLKLVSTTEPDLDSPPKKKEGQDHDAPTMAGADPSKVDSDPTKTPAAPLPPGVKIASISPFRKALWQEFQPGDVITALNGKAVTNATQLRLAWEQLAAGDQVDLSIFREEQTLTLQHTIQVPKF